MPRIFTEKFLERMRLEKLRSVSGKCKKLVERTINKAKTSAKGKSSKIQKKGTTTGQVRAGACKVGEKSGDLVQGRGKPISGHVGCTEADRALEALGVNPKNVNLCTKAAIMRGHIKITGQAGDLEQEIIKEKGECGHIIIATLGDLLKQTDLDGLDYGEGCGNATFTCKECNYERTCVVTVCEGNFSFGSKFESDKLHYHCLQCPGFGQCNGDHREAHCSRCGGIGCGKHYFREMTGFSCDNCNKSKRQRQSWPAGESSFRWDRTDGEPSRKKVKLRFLAIADAAILDMTDHTDGELTRKKLKLRFAIADAAIVDKLMHIKKGRGKQVRRRAGKSVSPAMELDDSLKRKSGRNDSEVSEDLDANIAAGTRKGSRTVKESVCGKKGCLSLEKEGGGKGGDRVNSTIPTAPGILLAPVNLCSIFQKASSMKDKPTEVLNLQHGVEVPNWKEDKDHLKCVSNTTSTEKSQEEPTDDATYLKRHNKHEKKEKQMKRWDDQRMRREQQLRELRERQEKKSLKQSKSYFKCQSLLPALEAVTAICVQDTIPVSIFGRPLPEFEAKDFSLPWL